MLYHLLPRFADVSIVFNLFRYITFRAAGAVVTSLLVAFVVGPWAIRWLASLPEDLRKIVVEEAQKAGASVLKSNVEQADKIFADIEAKGVKVHKIDTAPFREAVQPIYGELGLTDIIAETKKALGK